MKVIDDLSDELMRSAPQPPTVGLLEELAQTNSEPIGFQRVALASVACLLALAAAAALWTSQRAPATEAAGENLALGNQLGLPPIGERYSTAFLMLDAQPHAIDGTFEIERLGPEELSLRVAGCQIFAGGFTIVGSTIELEAAAETGECSKDPVAVNAVRDLIGRPLTAVVIERGNLRLAAESFDAILSLPRSMKVIQVDARVPVDNTSYAPEPFEFEFLESVPVTEAIAWAKASGFTNIVLDSLIRAGEIIQDRSLSIDTIVLNDDDNGIVSTASFGG